MKRLILFLLLFPALCFADMNPYIAGQTVESGDDWTPYDIQIYEGASITNVADYKIIIYNSSGTAVALSAAITYSSADDYVTGLVSGTPTDIVASSTYYAGFVNPDNGTSWSTKYSTTATTWGLDLEGGSYASPDTSVNVDCAQDQGQHSAPMLRVRNEAGEILLEWGGTASGDDNQDANDLTRVWCDSATSESSPQ